MKPRGMKEEDISKLPTRTYRKRSSDKDSVEECRVCLNGYKSGERLALLGCKHEYHIDCIKEWLKVRAVWHNSLILMSSVYSYKLKLKIKALMSKASAWHNS